MVVSRRKPLAEHLVKGRQEKLNTKFRWKSFSGNFQTDKIRKNCYRESNEIHAATANLCLDFH